MQSAARPGPITVNTPSCNYAVRCRRGLLDRIGPALSTLEQITGVFPLSSRRVWRHWGARVQQSLGEMARPPILFDDRETAKNLRTVEALCRQLSRAGADRRAVLLALGGGVVGDVAGFAAAAYLRGVRLVHVPTTLVAQVDSAIGGKTGVNLPEGKNLVGAFYQPRLVLADPDALGTLPPRQYRSGVFEIIKYGVIGGAQFFERLETNIKELLRREPEVLDGVIRRCIEAKARIVSQDERESGPRAQLNFGHTFAHALEAVTRYRTFLHGEAVGLGMIAAAQLAVSRAMLPSGEAQRLEGLVRSVGAVPAWPRASAATLLAAMRGDKKSRAGKLRFVLPKKIGEVEIGVEASDAEVLSVLEQMAREGKGGRGRG